MFENIVNFFKKHKKTDKNIDSKSKETAKERLHLVLMQDRANVSADFLDMMKQEIIEVIKKYIDIDEKAIDVKLTNKMNEDGTVGAPALYANIPIVTIKNDARKINKEDEKEEMPDEDVLEENNKKDSCIEDSTENGEGTTEVENVQIKVEEPDSEKNDQTDIKESKVNNKEELENNNKDTQNEEVKEETDKEKSNK